MSDYCKMKVLRIPFEYAGIGSVKDYEDITFDLHNKYGDMFWWGGKHEGRFDFAPTVRPFIDFVLEHDSDDDACGDYGKVRELTPVEKLKYIEVFHKLSPNIDMDKVKLVEFCWYNCCEAPDYYDPVDDEFYREIPFICNFT